MQAGPLASPDIADTIARVLRAEVTSQIGSGAFDVSWPATITRITGRIDADTGVQPHFYGPLLSNVSGTGGRMFRA
jgi:hypothetical protein